MINIWDYLRRINGFSVSTPVAGVGLQWEKKEKNSEIIHKIAREVIIFLEDRRVLYIENRFETPAYCIKSVHEIRDFLTEKIVEIPEPRNENEISELELSLRQMRAACQTVMTQNQNIDSHHFLKNKEEDIDFIMSIVMLRNVFALNIKRISQTYKIEVREPRLNEIINSYTG